MEKKTYPPLTPEEWKEIEEYQKIPFSEKLAMIDRMREFMYQMWKQNPETYEAAQRYRRSEV